MANLSDETRADSVAKLRQAADLLEAGDELSAGRMILAGLTPVAMDLKKKFGPMVKPLVRGWINSVLGG